MAKYKIIFGVISCLLVDNSKYNHKFGVNSK